MKYEIRPFQDLHYRLMERQSKEGNDIVRDGIVPMETPFLMEQVMDDGMAACVIM